MSDILHRRAAINKSFSAIGVKNGSAPPDSKLNTFAPLYEFFVADALRSMANKRYDAAKENLASVVDLNKIKEGAQVRLVATEHFDIDARQNVATTTLDRTMLKNELTKRYGSKVADDIITKSSKPKKGAVTISCTMKDFEGESLDA